MTRTYNLKAKVWLWKGEAGWHFVTLPKQASEEIDFYFAHLKHGWGSLRVNVSIGNTTWKTSIFPSKELGSYVLPLKAEVRKKEHINQGSEISFSISVES